MSRVILLTPLENRIIVTKIILGLIDIAKKNNKKVAFFKLVTVKSDHKKNIENIDLNTVLYEKKIVSIIKSKHIKDISYFYNEANYLLFIENIVNYYYKFKTSYDIFIIEGINITFTNDIEFRLNIDIAKSLNAEVVFSVSFRNKLDKLVINYIKFILNQHSLKLFHAKRISFILNKLIYSKLLHNKNYFGTNFESLSTYQNLSFLTKELKNLISLNLISVIGCIPWYLKFSRIPIIKIVDYFKKETIFLGKIFNHSVECYNVFDQNSKKIIDQISEDSLIVIPFERIDLLKLVYVAISKGVQIQAIILTGHETSILNSKMIRILEKIEFFKVSLFSTNESTLNTIFKLQKFSMVLLENNFEEKRMLPTYISNYIDKRWMNDLFRSKILKIYNTPIDFKLHLKNLAGSLKKRIILPESTEPRILKAVSICHKLGIAKCVLLGNSNCINKLASQLGIFLPKDIEIIDPDLIRNNYISYLIKKRAQKGMNATLARISLQDDMMLSTVMLDNNEVDGVVSGAVNTTANTIRPALQIIKSQSNFSLVSSVFFMLFPEKALIYADCAINILPTAIQLADIAIQSANTAKLFGIQPKIAMISYATGNSSVGSSVKKVKEATMIVKQIRPDLIIDGPIQYDAAVDEYVSKLKSPGSCLNGEANVFIFPDLNTGNTVYKAVQRSCNITSIGPILQGLKKPINDLSRGSNIEDIIYTIAITAIQSAQLNEHEIRM